MFEAAIKNAEIDEPDCELADADVFAILQREVKQPGEWSPRSR